MTDKILHKKVDKKLEALCDAGFEMRLLNEQRRLSNTNIEKAKHIKKNTLKKLMFTSFFVVLGLIAVLSWLLYVDALCEWI